MRVVEDLLSNEDTGSWEKLALGVFVVGTFIVAVRTRLWSRLLRRRVIRSRHGRVHVVHARVVSWEMHGLVHVHPRGVSGGMHGLVHVRALMGRRIHGWVHGCRHDGRMADDDNVVKMAMWYGRIDEKIDGSRWLREGWRDRKLGGREERI